MASAASVILWNSVAAVVIACSIVSASRILRSRPAVRHALWALVLLKLVLPPLVHVPLSVTQNLGNTATRSSSGNLPSSSRIGDAANGGGLIESQFSSIENVNAVESSAHEPTADLPTQLINVSWLDSIPTAHFAVVFWSVSLTGTATILALVLVRHHQFGRILAGADNPDEKLEAESRRLAAKYGISRLPRLAVVDAKISPLLWASLFRSAIVLPKPLVRDLSAKQLTAVLAHEMAHLRRGDHIVCWCATAITAICWWNPVAWIARRNLIQAQEECCDALVTSTGVIGRRVYAETLLTVVDFQAARPQRPSVAPSLASYVSLQRRFEMLRHQSTSYQLSRSSRTGIVLLLLALLCAPMVGETTAVDNSKAAAESDEANVTLEDVIKSIEANYQTLQSVEVSYERLSIDPNVKTREKHTAKSVDGSATMTFVQSPLFIHREDVRIKGDRFFSDLHERVGNEWSHRETVGRNRDVWTFFHRESNWAQRKFTHQLGGFFPRDPRDFGGLGQKCGLLDQMKRSAIVSQRFDGQLITMVAKMVDPPKHGFFQGQEFTYVLDRSKNYLPVRVSSHGRNRAINVLIEISYEEVVPKTTWFPRSMTTKFFGENAAGRDPNSSHWNSMTVVKAVQPIRVNGKVSDDDMTVKFDLDTRVVDMVAAEYNRDIN